jgi:hypothetical protein
VTSDESTPPRPGLLRAHLRLREELADDGIDLPGDEATIAQLLSELLHARQPPIFERRTPSYGSLVLPFGRSLLRTEDLIDLVDLHLPIDEARRFADGRSTYLVLSDDGLQLACFRRSVQYEADLVDIQTATGAIIAQRTVMGTQRLFVDDGVIDWTGRAWVKRPSAEVHLPSVRKAVPEAPRELLLGLLNLCVHWLSPARIGATLLLDVDPRRCDGVNLDMESSLVAPRLSAAARHHYPALFAVLMQTDLATLVGPDGMVTRLGVGLRSSTESEEVVLPDGGMRHRSAARYTWDHDHTVAFVVSEDGPVTVFRRGKSVAESSQNL